MMLVGLLFYAGVHNIFGDCICSDKCVIMISILPRMLCKNSLYSHSVVVTWFVKFFLWNGFENKNKILACYFILKEF